MGLHIFKTALLLAALVVAIFGMYKWMNWAGNHALSSGHMAWLLASPLGLIAVAVLFPLCYDAWKATE